MKKKCLLLIVSLLFLGSLAVPVSAQSAIRVTNDRIAFQFPESAAFSAEIQSTAQISSVVLEYGVDQLTCGTVIAEAFPDFTPATDVKASWTWEMRQTGSLPPGASLWWRWRVTDAAGNQFTSPEQTATWLDHQHAWQTLTGGDINLHWYSGGAAFGQTLHDSAAQALVRLTRDIGVKTDRPVDLYIYANTQDMQAAILYEPSWTGGEAFPENNIVIIGITPSELDWGKSTEAHELTHVLVGHETFSCLGFVPTWLNEGLAVYGEGGPDSSMQSTFDSALAGNTLSSVRSLSGNFPEAIDQANLAYGESYSLVNYLIKQYGRDKMTALLLSLRDGNTADQALQTVYGFDVDGLEDAWRTAIGAPSRTGGSQPTPLPTPTIVPTIEPIAGVPFELGASPTAASATPVLTPTPVVPQATTAAGSAPNASNTGLILAGLAVCACLLAFLVLLVLAIVFGVRLSRRAK
jgi:hypothetical protein